MKDGWEKVAEFSQSVEAEMAKSFLISNGIECQLTDANIVDINWLYSNFVGGVKLFVPNAQADEAKKLLADPQGFSGAEDLTAPDEISKPQCPRCHSENTEQLSSPRRGIAMIIATYTGLPVTFLGRDKWRCKSCDHEWVVHVKSNWLGIIFATGMVMSVLLVLWWALKAFDMGFWPEKLDAN
jgi:hypothetical protein